MTSFRSITRVVIEGEMTLVLDDGEVLLKPGTVVIQRVTSRAWANRSSGLRRMLFVAGGV